MQMVDADRYISDQTSQDIACMFSYPDWFERSRAFFKDHYRSYLTRVLQASPLSSTLEAAAFPGRRVFPALYIAFLPTWPSSPPRGEDLLPAIAVELFYTALAIVDDIIDQEECRRNKSSLYKRHGVEKATLTSHILIAQGYECLTQHSKGPLLTTSWAAHYSAACRGESYDLVLDDRLTLDEQQDRILAKTTPFFAFIADAINICTGQQQSPDLTSAFKILGRCSQIGNDIVGIAYVTEAARLVPDGHYPLRLSYLVPELVRRGIISSKELMENLPFQRHHQISQDARHYIQDAQSFLAREFFPMEKQINKLRLSERHRRQILEYLISMHDPQFWLHYHATDKG